jgi:hypothetical protein
MVVRAPLQRSRLTEERSRSHHADELHVTLFVEAQTARKQELYEKRASARMRATIRLKRPFTTE